MPDVWNWPIEATRYDRSHDLAPEERRFLTLELPLRIKTSKTRQPTLGAVERLSRPLQDVFDHIKFKGPKRRSLVFYLLEEMGRRDRTLWAWTDGDWIELVESRRHDANSIIAAAFLLGCVDALGTFPGQRYVFSCLARRVFGRERIAAADTKIKAGLQGLGYRIRTLRLVPLTLAKLMLITRSPRIEDVTEAALLRLQHQNATAPLEQCVVALSRFLASLFAGSDCNQR